LALIVAAPSDGRFIHFIAARCHIIDANGDDIAAALFAEQSQITLAVVDLKFGPDRPDMAGVAVGAWRR
jgi:hypothetical protein